MNEEEIMSGFGHDNKEHLTSFIRDSGIYDYSLSHQLTKKEYGRTSEYLSSPSKKGRT